jgi:hypothetical protein
MGVLGFPPLAVSGLATSPAVLLRWYACAGYPSWKYGGLHFIDALEELGYTNEEARDMLTDSYITYLDSTRTNEHTHM